MTDCTPNHCSLPSIFLLFFSYFYFFVVFFVSLPIPPPSSSLACSLSLFLWWNTKELFFSGTGTNNMRYCVVIFLSKWRAFIFCRWCIMAWLYNVMCFSVKPRLRNGSARFFISLSEHFISKPLINHAVCERDAGDSSVLHSQTSLSFFFFFKQKCTVFLWTIYNVPHRSCWVLHDHYGLFLICLYCMLIGYKLPHTR